MILILGANGQLGTEFKEYFDRLGLEYIGIDKGELDITKKEIVRKYIIDTNKFKNIKIIINCAAYTDVDNAEEDKEECYKINMEAAVNLALIAIEINADYITYSTDFVFSSQIAKYLYNDSVGLSEEDETLPLSTYSQSKYEAEVMINQIIENTNSLSKIYIIRTSWLFGKKENNFIEKILNLSKREKEIYVVDDQISSPTYTKDLTEYTWKLLMSNGKSGLYHFTNDGIVSRFDYAKYILNKVSWNGELIPIKTEETASIAKRPHFSKLNCKKIKETLGESIPHWTDAVDRYFREVYNI